MKKKIKISFLLDKKNDWIKKYLNTFLNKKNKNYSCKIVNNYKKVKKQNIVFILNYTKILPKSFLIKNSLNLVVHASDLPKGKGFAPIQWQILESKNKIPICLIEADKKFDSGAIIEKKYFYLKGDELNSEIRDIQAKETIKIISKFLKKFPKFTRKSQKGKSTFYKRRYAKDSKLNINDTLKESFNLLRIADNDKYPAYFQYKRKKYVIKIFKVLD